MTKVKKQRVLSLNQGVVVICLTLALFAQAGCGGTGPPEQPVTTGVIPSPDYPATPGEEKKTQELSFTSLERSVTTDYVTAEKFKKPALRIFAWPQDFEEQGEFNSVKELVGSLNDLDYENYFAILVLEGETNIRKDKVEITEILRQGERVIVRAGFPGLPSENEELLPVVALPYHLVAVRKDGEWGKEMTFVLEGVTDGVETTLLETKHFIP